MRSSARRSAESVRRLRPSSWRRARSTTPAQHPEPGQGSAPAPSTAPTHPAACGLDLIHVLEYLWGAWCLHEVAVGPVAEDWVARHARRPSAGNALPHRRGSDDAIAAAGAAALPLAASARPRNPQLRPCSSRPTSTSPVEAITVDGGETLAWPRPADTLGARATTGVGPDMRTRHLPLRCGENQGAEAYGSHGPTCARSPGSITSADFPARKSSPVGFSPGRLWRHRRR